MMSAAGASQSVFDYLDRKPVHRPSGTLQPEEFRGDIEFNNVSLVYPARPTDVAVQVNQFA
jgi:ABC-type multidrug transport system fused ATPase/permease subunit